MKKFIIEVEDTELSNHISQMLDSLKAYDIKYTVEDIKPLKWLQNLTIWINKYGKMNLTEDELFALKDLNLSKCNLKYITDDITNLKNLESLDLSNNYIESIPNNFYKLINLTILDLSLNNISMIKNSNLHKIKKLQYLQLDNNEISIYPQELKTLSNTITISIANNYI
jgi:Leucine-rich repeat (LRR) protein